jgi:hypothetical protein
MQTVGFYQALQTARFNFIFPNACIEHKMNAAFNRKLYIFTFETAKKE